uniref:Protein kinase domain-containing protein n=1 Tax=Panagrellus redivivus TaxID=6233 RepID=A0A7E4ZY46_PANRE
MNRHDRFPTEASPNAKAGHGLTRPQQIIMTHFQNALEQLPKKPPPGMTCIPPTNDFTNEGVVEIPDNSSRIVTRVYDNYNNLTSYRFSTKEVRLDVHLNDPEIDFMQKVREHVANLYLLLYPNESNHLKKALYVDHSGFVNDRRPFIIFEKYTVPLRHFLRSIEYRKFEDASGQYITTSVAKAIRYLNRRGLSHENICVDTVYINSHGTVILGDFDKVATHQRKHLSNGITSSIIEQTSSHYYGNDMLGLGLIWMTVFWPYALRGFEELKGGHATWHDAYTDQFKDHFDRQTTNDHRIAFDDAAQDVYIQFFKNGITIDEFLGDRFYVELHDKEAFVNDLQNANFLPLSFTSELENNENIPPRRYPSAPIAIPKRAINGQTSENVNPGDAVYVTVDFLGVPRIYKFVYPYGDEVALFGKLRSICDRRTDVLQPSDVIDMRSCLEVALRQINEGAREGSCHMQLPSLKTPICISATLDYFYIG